MKKIFKKLIIVLVVLLVLGGIAAVQFMPGTVSSSLSIFGSKQMQIAHRGLSSVYPESSEDAYIAAGKAGYSAAECDVHNTKDGVLIVMHDDSVDRTTDGTGEIEEMTWAEIQKLSIDTGNGIDICENKSVILLSRYLEICKEYNMIPYIELKKLDVKYLPDIYAMLDDYGMRDTAVFISFVSEYLDAARELDPDFKMMLLSNKLSDDDVKMCIEKNYGIDFDFLKLYKYLPQIKAAKNAGLELAAWTVDMPIVGDFLHLLGCDNITTNRILPEN